MNTIEKIKELLNDPAVESISVSWDNGSVASFLPCAHADIDLDVEELGEPESFSINFHEWPQIEIGDTVMTKDGEGTVLFIDEHNQWAYQVRLKSGNVEYYERHEIALLKAHNALLQSAEELG